MATRRKNNKKMSKSGKIALTIFLSLLLFLLIVVGVAAVNAGTVRVRRAEVIMPDLPASFDGATILFITDIDLCGLNTAQKSSALFKRLQTLHPDMLILGGDYTSTSLLDILNRTGNDAVSNSKKLRERSSFFHYISDFDAPLGKFAISSPDDPDINDLDQLMLETGVRPLYNDRAAISFGSDRLWLVGISNESANLNATGNSFARDDCVIVAAYSPSVLPILLTSEASNGGRWADVVLSGHTHGGQIRIFGRNALQLNHQEQQYISGWFMENGLPVLVSEGLGCEGANLRVNTTPEVWFIKLCRT